MNFVRVSGTLLKSDVSTLHISPRRKDDVLFAQMMVVDDDEQKQKAAVT